MNRNPLIPFALIAILGIGAMFLFSFVGLDNADEMAHGGEETEEAGEATTPEELYAANCLSCHGDQLQGGFGPALANIGSKYDAETIQGIITNGQGSMPAIAIDAEKAQALATWLSEKK
ncbi:cytochrome c550 [Bacillus mesophilus]|uniref:Cytochrome c n=1 Tax=Bacillus mesophilus TaxID=1808955 RepID=A0A6M0Q5P0_9BACI|nr:cytochrome c [Bacillus mesophilus]MBM7660808.1 cytochrome c550 [Bacillus mesophilus]NEY71645.1 cytochrome c [Bacillus mesophilus]